VIISPLYEKWKQLVQENSSGAALTDVVTGRSWSFRELDQESDELPALDSPIVMPRNSGKEFILAVLQAWRDGAVLCPLEGEARSPKIETDDVESFPDAVCHMKLTSGSTGEPRKILFRPEQLICDADRIVRTMSLRADSPNIGVLSLAHSYGFSNLVLPLLLHGIPLIWLGNPLPGVVRKALASPVQNGPGYTLAAVPAMWRAWLNAGMLAGGSIHLAISAGAPLTLSLEREIWETCGIKIHNFYGSSECGGIAYDDTSQPRTRAGEVGRAMVDTHLSIHQPDGCLRVKSKAVAVGYWPPGKGAGKLGKGIFQTTDQGEIDENGTVFLGDRMDDIIHVDGRKISPGKVETVIAATKGVKHCVVFGIPSKNPERNQEIVACVNLDRSCNRDHLERKIRNELRPFEVPRRWWVTSELQPDQRGKMSRTKWRRKFLDQ